MRADISSCMTTRHGEISCTHPIIHRHGKRRRRCSECGATWSVWKHRRGKKNRKRRTKSLHRTFLHGLTVRQQANLSGRNYEAMKASHRRTLESVSHLPWHTIHLRGRLILLLDGIWFRLGKVRWVAYVMAVRSISGKTAHFLRPIVCEENESRAGWERAIESIPTGIRKRISALVSDGLRGLNQIAKERGWVYQWCHFHLLGRMANVMGTRKQTVAWLLGRRRAEKRIRELIGTGSSRRVKACRRMLQASLREAECPRKIRMIIREVLRHTDELRAYRDHPELCLPATSNVMESLNSRLRNLAGRSHGFRTGKALERWIFSYMYFNSTSNCRPKFPQN